MHGGGKRANAIVNQLLAWQPDVIALAEFRATPASLSISQQLVKYGFNHQITTASPDHRARNGLLLASQSQLAFIKSRSAPEPSHRWLLAKVNTKSSFYLGVMHIPNMHTKLKVPYHKTILKLTKQWDLGRALLIGDTNSGLPDIDEESPAFGKAEVAFMNGMNHLDWKDMYRVLHQNTRAYTWYSPNGRNGFRLDQAFVNTDLQPYVRSFEYVWGETDEHNQLSDHAAILLDLDLPD